MSTWRRLIRRRPYALALAGGMFVLLAGDRAHLAPPPGVGIDPFEVLDQQVRNNVLIVLDTSGSMKWPSDRDDFSLGSDDPGSRMFQAKAAIRAVVQSNQNRVNFGLVSYNIGNLSKTINRTQNFEGDGRVDGPFIYVSADATAAPFYTVHSNAEDTSTGETDACAGIDGFFCRISATLANYDGANSADVWRSFMNRASTAIADPTNPPDVKYDDPYPAGCTPGAGVLSPVDLTVPAAMRCRYYMQSRLLRNNVRYTWNRTSNNITTRLTATAAIACPAPPAGLLGHAFPAPCYQIQDSITGNIATFYYSSAIYENQAGNSCGGGALIASVAECNANNAPLVLAKMDPELPVLPSGALSGVPAPPGNAGFDYADGHLDGDQTPDVGLRADQSTPLAGTLDFIRTVTNPTPAFPAGPVVPNQRNFVILVTDGDDTCADSDRDRAAVLSGEAAERLYNNFNPGTGAGDFQHWAETFVVGFASAVNAARVNVIAQAGSGRNINNGAATPAAALAGAPCAPGAACRDAFFASNTQQLIDILNAALEQASNTGFFSATPSVFSSVPEYANTVPQGPFPAPFDVMNPENRYVANATRAYRATFEAGTFRGKVTGFDSGGAIPGWEAGQRLMDPDRISPDLATADHTFAELQVSSSPPFPPGDLPNNPHIHRRIFTTRQNGRRLAGISISPDGTDDLAGTLLCAGGPCRVNLWPPDPGVVQPPADFATPSSLDDRLFRKADGTQMVIAELQAAPWRACMGTAPAGHPCLSLTPTVKLAAAQKEMREMVLAFTAGAEPRRDPSLNPVRNAAGQIVYRRRNFLLSESTIGTPSLVTQPINITPTVHTPEYLLYRDGPRDANGSASGGNTEFYIRKGLGLRHPDRDGQEVPVGGQVRDSLKPSMSMILVPSNDMLHAFRAGPCPGNVARCGNGTLKERGGEELWAFVPHDLLPSLKDRMKSQTRSDHTYMISASLRTADVFLPGAGTLTVNGRTYTTTGRWRRLLLFGRGMGGKYYTAMDITGIGSLTSPVLQTQLPGVLWSRGNPDTVDGLPASLPNGSGAEFTAYLDMGMTWSTPAVARVNPANNQQREFVAYVGSGYSTTDPREGTRFYTLDPFNGDIVASDDVGEGGQPLFQNALVANPVIYAAERLVRGIDLPHPATPVNQSVFIGDIHGRLWRFDSNAPGTRQQFRDLGFDQPMGVGAALLNLNGSAHVFVETGADARVAAPAGGFRMFGFRDSGPPYPTNVQVPPLAAPEFGLSFPPPPAGKGDFRGTVQPLTRFEPLTGQAQVFFTGTRFNPVSAGRCVSSFDTIIFALVADTGGTAYATTEYEDAKAIGLPRPPVPTGSGPPPFDEGTAPQGQEPGAPPVPPPSPGTKAVVKTVTTRPASTVCR